MRRYFWECDCFCAISLVASPGIRTWGPKRCFNEPTTSDIQRVSEYECMGDRKRWKVRFSWRKWRQKRREKRTWRNVMKCEPSMVCYYLLSAYLVWPLDYPEKMVQTFREYFVVKQKNGENARSFTFTCSIDHFLYIIPFSLSQILSVHEITENWFINHKYDLQCTDRQTERQ